MSPVSRTQVLVVGGGAAGPVAAWELARRDVQCRVIDQLPGPQEVWRAFTVHSGTLRRLSWSGLDSRLLDPELGTAAKAMAWYLGPDKTRAAMDFAVLNAPHPYVWITNQGLIEQSARADLAEHYGAEVEWGRRLVGFTQDDEGVTATVTNPDGEPEQIRADWMVACDGWQSSVRRALNVEFDTTRYSGQRMRMLEARLEGWTWPNDEVCYLVAPDHMFLVAPAPGDRHRLLISDMSETADARDTTRETFQTIMNIHFSGAVQLAEITPGSCSAFRIRHSLSAQHQVGRVLLAGDAANIVTPVAGQGLNSALCDVMNFGWRLAAVVHGASPTLLHPYGDERHDAAKQIQRAQLMIHEVILAHGTPIETRIDIAAQPGFRRTTAGIMSGTDITYRNTNTVPTMPPPRGIAPGDPVPAGVLTPDGLTVDRLLRGAAGRHALMLLSRPQSRAVGELQDQVDRRFGRWVHTRRITTPAQGFPRSTANGDADIFTRLRADNHDMAVLLRPDGYIDRLDPVDGHMNLLDAVGAAIGR